MSVMKWSSSFIIFAIFVLVSAQSEAKTALFKTQGIMEETCPEIAQLHGWTCHESYLDRVSAFRCRQMCSQSETPCYHMEEKSCFCCSK
ncbi:hypothetical protein TCAL_06730 [Tigriopus californicus]|uniref:Invertebrate defensins family profile domain-containing protein n=1 Tax=Tigriopus californicus TaxID=6832 RepID=A0A553P4R5_TIGCA|nr:hypothetical protein TCAL_06730 [Tigriopus californicus]